MKLYTEEQVRKSIRDTRYFTSVDSENDIVGNMTPIELPSDEEILNEAPFSFESFGFEQGMYRGFVNGAEWMREQIQKKIQKQLLSEIMQADEKDGLYENK